MWIVHTNSLLAIHPWQAFLLLQLSPLRVQSLLLRTHSQCVTVGGSLIHPSSRQKAFSPLTALLKGLQDFRSNDQTTMEFKYSSLNYEAHLPDVGPKLQLAYHFSHVMMAPFLFLSTVPSIPLEI